jgi:hypothetical protein
MRKTERLLTLFDNTRAQRWITLALIALAIAARLVPGPRMIDDAFITFRYARNLVHGAGLVYNAGERVLGTTTPVYAMLMAVLSLITQSDNFPILALISNALADGVSTYLLYHLGRRLSNSPLVGWAAALLWAISPMSVSFAVGGMETSVFILLMLAAFTLHFERRLVASAVLAALSFLTRPDAALIVVLILSQLLLESIKHLSHLKSRPAYLRFEIWVLIFVLIAGPWFIFATSLYGSPLPQSVAAKTLAYRLPPEAALGRFIQHLSVPFSESDVLDLAGLIRLVIYLSLYLAAMLTAFRREPRSLPFLAYPLLYTVVFAVANPLIFRWYLAPPLPAYMLGILLGIYQILNTKYPIKFGIRDWALGAVVAVYLIAGFRAWTLHPDHGPNRPAPEMAFIKLELLYHQVATDLKPFVNADTVIAAGDIGALGYDTGARILDTLGLISPQTLHYYPLDPKLYVINYAMPPQLILDQKPEWVVCPEVYIRNGLLKDARFRAQYQLWVTLPTDIYGSKGLMVFRRK